jgi:hypothetical protein
MVNLMNDRVHFPKWLAKATLYALIFMFIATGVSIWLAVKFYNESEKSKESASYWHEQYQAVKK